IMDAGQLVPNDIVLGMIKERLLNPDTNNGFILDGFPRNIEQAEALDDLLDDMNKPLEKAVLIDVDFDILMQRLTGRLTCTGCGAVYNMYTNPPTIDDECDGCGSSLHHRSDDNEETIGKRLKVYETQTQPVIDYYARQNIMNSVEGKGDIQDIFDEIVQSLATKSMKTQLPKTTPAMEPAVESPATPVVEKPSTPPAAVAAPATSKAKPAAPAKEKPVATKPAASKKPATKKKPAAVKPVAGKKKAAAKPATKKAPAKKKAAGSSMTIPQMKAHLANLQKELKAVNAAIKVSNANSKQALIEINKKKGLIPESSATKAAPAKKKKAARKKASRKKSK
ncbi:MAG: nucleoside monophosphate kinase, partial [Gammaproteobacteria bacterium]|nr:nucleoside monophosphate kinase [Gammaproteobacteria bacterium]